MPLGSTLAILRPAVKAKAFRSPTREVRVPLLTSRQTEIAPYLAEDYALKQIGAMLTPPISAESMKQISFRIYRRLGLKSRYSFIKWYWTIGFPQ